MARRRCNVSCPPALPLSAVQQDPLLYLRRISADTPADTLAPALLSCRTAFRYRLSVPAAKYAPWFGVVLKCARLAVKVLQLLSLEARASKLR